MGESITVWSTAYDQNRPYLDLNDAAQALAFIIRKDLFNGSIYNVLTYNATVRQVVETIREFVPTLKLSFVESEIMNQLSYQVSCEKFKAEGFSFSGNLQRGIGDTINLLRNANIQRP
jgi:nucleoside-diphosphate-sugar epimerase